MLDRFMNWVKETSNSLSSEVKKFKSKAFLEAAVAGCAIVAASDGVISPEEKRKMIGFISQNDALRVFDSSEAVKLFQKYADAYDFDAEVGKAQALKAVAQMKKKSDEARLLVRVCCAIGAADGNFDAKEKEAVRDICRELGQNPADFNLE
ncbi:MAG: tellurite resistance TerB family protein [Desulfovibrio sp.]|jgi:tellurite resistance protein TerB|nr:tellurite resistance TerB family protein [Desulfovibrio sp.]